MSSLDRGSRLCVTAPVRSAHESGLWTLAGQVARSAISPSSIAICEVNESFREAVALTLEKLAAGIVSLAQRAMLKRLI